MAAERSRLYGAQGWSLADVSIERSSRIDREGGGEPTRRAMLRKTPSATGKRQMLEVQTKSMPMVTA
jgi:hypothetical protein